MILKFIDIIPVNASTIKLELHDIQTDWKVTGYVIKKYMAEMDGVVHCHCFAAFFTVLKHCIRLYGYNLENGH